MKREKNYICSGGKFDGKIVSLNMLDSTEVGIPTIEDESIIIDYYTPESSLMSGCPDKLVWQRSKTFPNQSGISLGE